MNLTLAEATLGAGAMLEAPSSISFAGGQTATGYSIDSRTVAPGDLFFAVKGERFDGHDINPTANQRRTNSTDDTRAKHTAQPEAAHAVPLLVAEDSLLALQSL